MGFENFQLKNVDIIETHPGRVTRKDVSMEGMVRPISSVVHSGFYSFTNPQMHERRPNPLRFHRQMKFYQSAYHGSPFACYLWSIMDFGSRVATRYLFMPLKSPPRSNLLKTFRAPSRTGQKNIGYLKIEVYSRRVSDYLIFCLT